MANYEGADVLALEAAAACDAGMSYGKWKALGGKITPGDNVPLPKGWKVCVRCEKPFRPKKSVQQKYCCYDCRYEGLKEKDKEKKREYARAYREKQRAMAAE